MKFSAAELNAGDVEAWSVDRYQSRCRGEAETEAQESEAEEEAEEEADAAG